MDNIQLKSESLKQTHSRTVVRRITPCEREIIYITYLFDIKYCFSMVCCINLTRAQMCRKSQLRRQQKGGYAQRGEASSFNSL